MSFAQRILRAPHAYEPERGAEALAHLPALDAALSDLIKGTAGCSPYLAGLIAKEADWLADAVTKTPETAFADVFNAVQCLEEADLAAGLRQAKRRVALLTALADLGGVWSLEEVTSALTHFADLAVDRALRVALSREVARGKLPAWMQSGQGIFALAMGKMGAFELNYSSDIDLIVLFEGARFDSDDLAEIRPSLIRATRAMASTLSETTAEGYVFRTDLRLRPDAAVTPVCLSVEAAEAYYESVGRTWERAAYVKARAAAGDLATGERFLQALTPFVWRKHLDFAAIQDAHDMRLRIREHKGLHGPITLAGHDMKLGRGGIREIEFFTQTRQIIAGGRDRDLRSRSTVEALARLAEAGWVDPGTADTLTDAYRAHRTVEHRLQMIADAQTHALPSDARGFERLAAFMGMEVDALRAEVFERLTEVHALTDEFFAPSEPRRAEPAPDADLDATAVMERWTSYPALRSARAMDLFERLKPDLLARLAAADKPDEALEQFDLFLKGLPAGVQVFSLFQANPQLIDLIVDIAATAPALAAYLGRNAQVFDAVIGGDFFAPWPGQAALAARLAERLQSGSDYERRLDTARRWQKEWRFRIGVHLLRGLMDAEQAGRAYADLAEAVLSALWDPVVAEFAQKHGDPPGQGACVLGMGSLGAGRLSVASDLDIIVIYDAPGDAVSEGRRPLPARSYYARLTQAFVTALSAPMAEGTLYEVDMRLRPSGKQGPVATAWSGFQTYQREDAWTWEHLALTRAKPVAGSMDLGEAVEAFRQTILRAPHDAAALRADVADMRARLAEAKPPEGPWDVKRGAGRLQDIELLAQMGALLSGAAGRTTEAQLQAGAEAGVIGQDTATHLAETARLFWQIQAATRLLTETSTAVGALGAGGQQFLLTQTGAQSFDSLAKSLQEKAAAAARLIDAELKEA